jgi:hypothetical protein
MRMWPPIPVAVRLAAVVTLPTAVSAMRASAAAASPAAVGRIPRGGRSMTAVPSSRSIAAIWCDRAGWDMCSTTAALVSEP